MDHKEDVDASCVICYSLSFGRYAIDLAGMGLDSKILTILLIDICP